MTTDWDAYWEAKLAKGGGHRLGDSPFMRLARYFKNAWHRVLVVGCGISTEPALLARLGYEVVAFDVSAVAVAHVHEDAPTDDELASWLFDHLPDSAYTKTSYGRMQTLKGDALRDTLREALHRLARPGGTLTTTCQDFRQFVADRPFDVVYSPWSWQCLDDEDRATLPRSMAHWLAPGGAAYFATQNLPTEFYDELSSACAAEGLLRRHDEARRQLAKQWPRDAREWKQYSDQCGRDDAQLQSALRAGARMWDLYSASG